MRRPNRNIEIFSMSVLDLFAAALGAFILISVMLFPNYMKQQSTAAQLEQVQSQANTCVAASKQKDETLAACEAARDSTFVIVITEWSESGDFDIDLYVTDPKGHEFYWAMNNRTGSSFLDSKAQLSFDNTRGPGVELWQHPKAEPGIYKVSYRYAGMPTDSKTPVEVRGKVFFRNGNVDIPPVKMTMEQRARDVANISVKANGSIDVEILNQGQKK